jgi:glutathione S-transferase
MASAPRSFKIHDFDLSGHCHRVRLMMSLLGLSFERIPVDLAGGEHRREAFLSINPFGQVPVLRDADVTIADSNAILVYLAASHGGDGWLPRDPIRAARVQRWLSVAAGPLAYGPAAVRSHVLFGMPCDEMQAGIHRSQALLAVMDGSLKGSAFLVGETPTIADVACYTYVAHAPEGGISLDRYPNVRAWLSRIEALPGFVGMTRTTPPKAS